MVLCPRGKCERPPAQNDFRGAFSKPLAIFLVLPGTLFERREEARLVVSVGREVVLARENSGWGYTRIVGAMKNLGFTVARMTVARVLAEHGFDPAPNRAKGMSWSDFLRAHWGAIAAADFFTVEALTLTGLTRYHVLFVIDLKTRLVHIAGIVHEAC